MPVLSSAALFLAVLPSSLAGGATTVSPPPDTLLLTREDARAWALTSSPLGLVIRAEAEAAKGVARTDRIYPFNPTAEVKGSEALDPGGFGKYEAVFSQEIEWAGQWFVRRAAGGHAASAAQLEEEDAVRAFLLDVDFAFFRLRAAEESHRAALDGAELARGLREAVQARFREGAISALDLNLTTMVAGRAEAQGLAARNNLNRARQAVRDILGLEGETMIRTVEDTPPDAGQIFDVLPSGAEVGNRDPAGFSQADTLVELAMARRPDLLAARAREEEARNRSRLASMSAIPNLDVGAVLDRGAADATTTYGLRFAIPIPLWNRNQGERQQTRALEERAQALTRELELRVQGEVFTALETFRTATEELDLYESSVLDPARENRVLLQRAFELGRMDLPTVLLFQAQQVESEMAYWESWLRQREALAALEAAVGGRP